MVISAPDRAGLLVVYDAGRIPSTITSYRASNGTSGPALSQLSRITHDLVVDAQISPDGTRVVFNESVCGRLAPAVVRARVVSRSL